MRTDIQLTRNFWLSEFLQSETAARRGIDNRPTEVHLRNIRELLAPGMQRIRNTLNALQPKGAPAAGVLISSGYRSAVLNAAIGGSVNSQHMSGLAADFTAPRFGRPRDICQALLDHYDEIRFDQLIWEGSWVHVSFAEDSRRSILTAHFENGRVRYTQGLAA